MQYSMRGTSLPHWLQRIVADEGWSACVTHPSDQRR